MTLNRKIHIQLDPQFYITANTYNPAILVETTSPKDDVDPDDVDYDSLAKRKQWYLSSFESAIQLYARQSAVLHGDHGQQIKSFEQLAKVVDQALGLAKTQINDQKSNQPDVSDNSDDTVSDDGTVSNSDPESE